VNRCARAGPALDRRDLDVRAGARAQPLARLEVGGVDPLAEFGAPEGVAVGRGDLGRALAGRAVGVDRDLDEVLEALALDLGRTVSTRVSPVFSSVATTLSPPLTCSIGLVVQSAIRTFVPGTKLLPTGQEPLPLVPPLEREKAPVEPPLPELPPPPEDSLPAPEDAAAEERGAANAWTTSV
jgi:hypothetical protein